MEGRPDPQAQWEHYVEYVVADANHPQNRDFLAAYLPGQRLPRYAVQATIRRLNELGAQGWELVQMQPVEVGVNGDIHTTGEQAFWTNAYLCVFKRAIRTTQ